MKGDSCPYDHGNDAVILDDVASINQAEGHKTGNRILPPQIPGIVAPQPIAPQPLPIGMPFPPPPVSFFAFT